LDEMAPLLINEAALRVASEAKADVAPGRAEFLAPALVEELPGIFLGVLAHHVEQALDLLLREHLAVDHHAAHHITCMGIQPVLIANTVLTAGTGARAS